MQKKDGTTEHVALKTGERQVQAIPPNLSILPLAPNQSLSYCQNPIGGLNLLTKNTQAGQFDYRYIFLNEGIGNTDPNIGCDMQYNLIQLIGSYRKVAHTNEYGLSVVTFWMSDLQSS